MKSMVIEMLTLYGGNREKVVEQLNILGLVERQSESFPSPAATPSPEPEENYLDAFIEERRAEAEAERAEAEAAALAE